MLWTQPEPGDRSAEEEAGEGNKVQPGYGLRQSLIVLDQPPKPRRLRKIALHYPPSRQEHEATPSLQVLDHFKLDAVCLGLSIDRLAGVSLIHIRQLHRLAGRLLHGFG